MSFIEKNLAVNERILYKAKLHWWIYLKGILLFILGLVISFILKSDTGYTIGGLMSLISIIIVLKAYARSSSSEFAVTNRRVMLKTGAVKRKLTELQLNRAEGLRVDQSVMGRIFDYGDIIITSGGVTETFSPIAQPYEFKKQINNAIEGSFSGYQAPPAY